VDDFSSKLDLPRTLETVESIDANHIEMTRCHDRSDPRYRALLGVLKRFMRSDTLGIDIGPQDKPSTSHLEVLTIATKVLVTSSEHSEHSGPVRVLPFGRNKDFVGRQSKLNQLITILHTEDTREDCQRIALVGLGGVRKTQIALEFTFQLQSISPTCSLFWVRASDPTSFENAYYDIGQQLNIPGLEDNKANVKRLVKTRLSQESAGRWLMVVDNADDFEMFYNRNHDISSSTLSGYLPFSTLGAILFTTRDREAATRYASSNVIDIDEMDDEESRELLEQSLQNKQLINDKGSVNTLLNRLLIFHLQLCKQLHTLTPRVVLSLNILESMKRAVIMLSNC
jgi:hypothetical protein